MLPAGLSSQRPKGEQLEEILEGFVAALAPGMALPSERLLAERYGLARATVSQVIEGLAVKGLLYRVHGSGTFVAEPKFRQPETLTSFSEDMRARGMTPGSVVLGREVVAASEIIARQLEVEPGAPVLHVERVRTADGEPMALERTYLPAERFPGLGEVDLTDVSLYEVLERRWGVLVAVADQWFSVMRLTEGEAKLLGVGGGQPALLFQRVTRDPAGRVVEYVRSLYRGDRYEVHSRLRRPGLSPEAPGADRQPADTPVTRPVTRPSG
ncbi:MAG TPA: GntR family transcriptional regulator [Actinomycetota bacterium]|nr:GntR family transcriptional regulator [Actinomycetota bacterium]